jgi:hypothetical protein
MVKPYAWTQTLDSVTISFPVPQATRSREIDVQIAKDGIKAGLKNRPPIIEGIFFEEVNTKDSLWQLESSVVTVHLEKAEITPWPYLIGIATKPDPHSEFEYAMFLEEGIGGQPDTEKAFEVYRDAANRGSEFAQLKMVEVMLGRDTRFKNVEPDIDEAVDYLHMLAEQHNHPNAMFDLGMIYQGGLTGEKDYAKAEEYFTNAAMQGHYSAMYSLGLMYRKGDEEQGIEPQPEKAIPLWRKAAELGSPEGCYSLGMAFWMGDAVKMDLYMALAFFEKAHELDKSRKVPELLLKNIAEAEKLVKEEKEKERIFTENRQKILSHSPNPVSTSLIAATLLVVGTVFLVHFLKFAKK